MCFSCHAKELGECQQKNGLTSLFPVAHSHSEMGPIRLQLLSSPPQGPTIPSFLPFFCRQSGPGSHEFEDHAWSEPSLQSRMFLGCKKYWSPVVFPEYRWRWAILWRYPFVRSFKLLIMWGAPWPQEPTLATPQLYVVPLSFIFHMEKRIPPFFSEFRMHIVGDRTGNLSFSFSTTNILICSAVLIYCSSPTLNTARGPCGTRASLHLLYAKHRLFEPSPSLSKLGRANRGYTGRN